MKRTLSLILSFAFFVGTFSGVISAEAKSTSQLRSEKQKIQQQIDSAQSKLNKLSAEKKKNQEYLETLRSKINLLQDKIDSLEEDKSALQAEIDAIGVKIAKTEQNIAEAQAKIDQKQAEFDQTYQIYCQRLRAMYISGSASTLEVLLTCKDVSSMLTRAQMVKSVSQQDNAILDDLMKKMEEIEKEKKKLEEKRTELTNDKKQLESNKKELQSSIDEINKSKSELDSEVAECNSIMKELSSQSSEYMELIETNQAQLEQAEADKESQYEAMKLRIQFMYEHNDYTYVEVLLSSQSMADMLNKFEYINKISEYDRKMLEEYQSTINLISSSKVKLEEDKETLTASQEALQAQVDDKSTSTYV